ncbi:hypothetical protein ACFJGV_10575 [Cnuibacter sp. UC19_7]|uniref:hypothetical protein n=1 Tax=Cnuibacter sp. UC19_7 TaxID=3350166 RepID=UPI00366EA06E
MSFLHRSALAWAEAHSLSADVRWAQLEVMAFQRHPQIFQHFGEDGAMISDRERRARVTPKSRIRTLSTVLLVVLVLTVVFAPIAGGAVVVGDRFEFHRIEAERSVPISAVWFVIAAVAQVLYFVIWLAHRARFSWVDFGVWAVGVVFAGLALFNVPRYSAADGYDGWPQYQTPAIISLAIASVALLVVLLRFRSRDPDIAEEEMPASGLDADSVRELIASLPEDERRAIADDRDAAIDMLRMRMVITDAVCERARAQELGTLYLFPQAAPKGAR